MHPNRFPGPEEVQACMLADRRKLRQRLRGLKKRQVKGAPYDKGLASLWQQVAASSRLAERRRQKLPVPGFPTDLPISERWEEIAGLISAHQVIILCGETGSGKSTQLPKICAAMGRGVFGKIGHTQPRRIAARSLAARISEELDRELGEAVGYKVRFHDRVGPETHIKLMTDGILLAEIQRNRRLEEYDTLIIDEAHERGLNIDFLLGYLKDLLPKRPDLKLIITSATIDPARFSKHFHNAPVINVSGRSYPVEVRYRPVTDVDGGERDEPLQQGIVDAVDELGRTGRGDILVFLSGEREIRETAESLRKHRLQHTELLPLYSRLGRAEQNRIFNPAGLRRIILATNVAETSLTVPGIRYVIDAGYARISRYSHRSKIQRLPVEKISRASADQRKGRCGRVAAGICIRLYEEEDFQSRAEFTEPEIQRTNLASVILQMKVLGFGEVERFPFLDCPDARLIKDGYRVLEEIGAVDRDRKISRLGRKLAQLPIDPSVGSMLLVAARSHCLREVLVIAAALSIQDPRERPLEKQQAADEAHHMFMDEQSDFVGLLKLWAFVGEKRRHLSRNKFKTLCRENFLSWIRIQEWHDIHHQLRGQMREMGYRENTVEAGYEAIHRSLLTGLLSNIGFKKSAKEPEYLGSRNGRFVIFPGSGLFKKQPKWIAAAEIVETSRTYARTLASIRPEWVEDVALHLVQRNYSEPHWEKGRGQVAAYERVLLFGLTLIFRRKINYGPLDPVQAREIFIRSALVDGDFHTRAPFWRHNRELIEYLEHMEHKTRRRDLLVDEFVIYQYYDRRIPEGIYSTPEFEKWLRKATKSQPKLLHMRLDDLARDHLQVVAEEYYPDHLAVGGMTLPLKYKFEPGSVADGVTLRVPLSALNQVPEARCEWLVPGMLLERITAMLRGLPKYLRKSFVPVPEYAEACLQAMEPSDRPLTQALAEQLKEMTGVYIPEDAWQEQALPSHLRMNFQLIDDKGLEIDSSRDLVLLRQRFKSVGSAVASGLGSTGLERDDIREWDFGTLPESIVIRRGGIDMLGFPALVDRGDKVDLRVLNSASIARYTHRSGVRRLIMRRLGRDIRYLHRNLPGIQRMSLQYAKAAPLPSGLPEGKQAGLEDELIALILDLAFIEGMPEIRNQDVFYARIDKHKSGLAAQAAEALALLKQILDQYQLLRRLLDGSTQVNWVNSLKDLRLQLDKLVFRGFLQHTPYPQLRQFPRYLNAMAMRFEKLGHALQRDRRLMEEMRDIYQQWLMREEKYRAAGKQDSRIEELRWAFEELRVSLFAQELGTAHPISVKRIVRRWRELGL